LGLGPWGKQATGPARENNKRGSKGEEGRGGGRPSRREGDREGVAHRVRAAGDTVDASVRGVRGDGARRGKGHQSQASAEGAVGQGGASDSEARHWPGRRGDGLGHPEWERSCSGSWVRPGGRLTAPRPRPEACGSPLADSLCICKEKGGRGRGRRAEMDRRGGGKTGRRRQGQGPRGNGGSGRGVVGGSKWVANSYRKGICGIGQCGGSTHAWYKCHSLEGKNT